MHIRSLFFLFLLFALLCADICCVKRSVYDNPTITDTQCAELIPTKSFAEVKGLLTDELYVFDTDDVLAGYVSSSDELGNIYKTIYIQDDPHNPTQGLTISIDLAYTYLVYPQGAKVFIRLKGLCLGKYAGVIQIGYLPDTQKPESFGRIPERIVPEHLIRSCTEPIQKLEPHTLRLKELGKAIDAYIGCLIRVDSVEFIKKHLCTTYAPEAESIDLQIIDPSIPKAVSTKVVRNSGYASFATLPLPTGNGTLVGVLGKYNSIYQFYIIRPSDIDLSHPRLDGVVPNCVWQSEGFTLKTIDELKQAYADANTWAKIQDAWYLRGRVTSSDKTGNHYKYIYIQDYTGAIKIRINKTNLYQDPRFALGTELVVSLQDLYIHRVYGEYQIGGLYAGNFGNIEDSLIHIHFFRNSEQILVPEPLSRRIEDIGASDVGRLLRIEGVECMEQDLGRPYAEGATTNRILKTCSGESIVLRTSSYANFASELIDGGNGVAEGILSVYQGVYQLWLNDLRGIQLTKPRCDGRLAPHFATLFEETFDDATLGQWTTLSITGTQKWTLLKTAGNASPCIEMNGYTTRSNANEAWLVSKKISIPTYTTLPHLTFCTDWRFVGQALLLYISTDYETDVSKATWIPLEAVLDTDPSDNTWTYSKEIDLSIYKGRQITLAFKYLSTTSASARWRIDNIRVRDKW